MSPDSTASKVCTKCGGEKPLEAFYRCSGYKDGRARTCITCERIYKRRPDVMAKARETASASHGRKQARRRGLLATLTQAQWNHAVAYFDGCAYCGSTEGTLHKDHFIPEFRGGAFTADNIVPACGHCNYCKHQRMPQEWCTPEAYARVLAYFASLDLTPNGDRPLREPKGYATGEEHGSKTHPERIPRGEQQWQSRLTESQVVEIRRRYAAHEMNQNELAAEYGVSQTMIGLIVRRKCWQHVK